MRHTIRVAAVRSLIPARIKIKRLVKVKRTMVVKTQKDGRALTGLHIGRANARRFFRRRAQSIDLMLDDLQIRCALSPDFWHDRPEIHDPRLSEWLEFKAGRGRAGREPMVLTMLPFGADTFVVKPKTQSYAAFGAEVPITRKPKSESPFLLGPVPALESRSVA